jgi:hypothetical protein
MLLSALEYCNSTVILCFLYQQLSMIKYAPLKLDR